jgi:hypothetical protein
MFRKQFIKNSLRMISYQKEKIENAICFFALNHKKVTKQNLPQTFLYKYLAMLDFQGIKDNGIPVLGLTYRAMDYGPVPIEIYGERERYKSECFDFVKLDEKKIVIVPKKDVKPDLDYFSTYEIKSMNKLIDIFADKFITSKVVSDVSHVEIKAWARAREIKKNSFIDYALNFDGDIREKRGEELKPAEKNYLIFNSLETLSK